MERIEYLFALARRVEPISGLCTHILDRNEFFDDFLPKLYSLNGSP